MPKKPKRQPGEPPQTSTGSPETVRLIVRRGALRRFDRLTRDTRELPVTVAWDRRQGGERASSGKAEQERRDADRREAPPFTWEAADFLVVSECLGPDVDPEED
jgi:hypothetical protein